jgi:hypothetical protein
MQIVTHVSLAIDSLQVLEKSVYPLRTSLKLSSLVLTLLSKHSHQLAPHKQQLSRIAANLETNLKKSIANMVAKIP